VLAPLEKGRDGPPQWAIASWQHAEIWGREEPASWVVGLEYGCEADGGRSADLVSFFGYPRAWRETGEQLSRTPPPGPRPLGRDCAVLHERRWWVVDPVTGSLWIPSEPPTERRMGAVGLAPAGDKLLVATADQRIHVLDPSTGEIVRTFPATVVPARRLDFGECAMLATGRDWIASLDWLRGVLHVYDDVGAPLGRVRIAQLLGTVPDAVHAIRGAGDYLGVGHDLVVATLHVARDATCACPAPAECSAGAGHSAAQASGAAPTRRLSSRPSG
jgi:hypothetical protein